MQNVLYKFLDFNVVYIRRVSISDLPHVWNSKIVTRTYEAEIKHLFALRNLEGIDIESEMLNIALFPSDHLNLPSGNDYVMAAHRAPCWGWEDNLYQPSSLS